jgi:hypothetical protein
MSKITALPSTNTLTSDAVFVVDNAPTTNPKTNKITLTNLAIAIGTHATTIVPVSNGTYNLGSSNNQWNNIFVSNTIYLDGQSLTIGNSAGIIANGSIGSNGQVLTSNGSSLYWSTKIPEEQVFILNADRALVNQSALQSWFGVGVTLRSSTRYRYRLISTVFKSSSLGTYAVTFALGGTAVLARHFYVVNPCGGSTQITPTTTLQMSENKTTNFNVATTITGTNSGATYYAIIIDGVIDVTTGGTVIPEIGFTGTPGSSSLVQAAASIEIYPVNATGANTVVGAWA